MIYEVEGKFSAHLTCTHVSGTMDSNESVVSGHGGDLVLLQRVCQLSVPLGH